VSRAEAVSAPPVDGSSAAGDPAHLTSAHGDLQRQVDELVGSQADLAARQFSTVRRATYSFDGRVSAFYEWLQLSSP